MVAANPQASSPWRPLFEEVRQALGNQRDPHGVIGSINWLRKQMERKGANPNVVRNIIYRDKGKPSDKRALLEILRSLWRDAGLGALQAPELEVLLATNNHAEQEVMQLLGREKRRAYRDFVSAARAGAHPKMTVTGRAGSGKTMLSDYIQQALELPPKTVDQVVRLEFSSGDLATSLARLAQAVGVPSERFASRLVRIGSSSAFSVQADAQAEIARVILEALRQTKDSVALLIHISQSLGSDDSLGGAPLRLNTPDVPRVSTAEWLWLTLLGPLSSVEKVSLLVSISDLPARAAQQLGHFTGPIKLTPPSMSEARRFIKARLPHLTNAQQEALVQKSGRSFEELRTLTLLADLRDAVTEANDSTSDTDRHIQRLGRLVECSNDARLKTFLGALAVLSLAEFPIFKEAALAHLCGPDWQAPTNVEQAFLDAVPGQEGHWRCFSRQLARALREELQQHNVARYRELHRIAASYECSAAEAEPSGEVAGRYFHHLIEARAWPELETWLSRYSISPSLLRRVWQHTKDELVEGETFERLTLQVASHYVRLGSYHHTDAREAFAVLAASDKVERRAWTSLKQAEAAAFQGRFEEAEVQLADWPEVNDPILNADVALVRATVARWRSHLDEAAWHITHGAEKARAQITHDTSDGRLVHAKVAVWSGLVAKDRGDLEAALTAFSQVSSHDDLIGARVAFQKGDVEMRLGHYDSALAAFDEAVARARLGEAPGHEQARYLARRATLRRRRGELSKAQTGFDEALAILHSASETARAEVSLTRTKILGEMALLQLARGHFDQAILQLQRNNELFDRYQQDFQVDASFRMLRSELHLALAYRSRATGVPYRFPLNPTTAHADCADLHHAQELLAQIKGRVFAPSQDQERYGNLQWRTLSLAGIIAEPDSACRDAERATQLSRYPYQKALSQAFWAAALLRAEQPGEALAQLGEARGYWQQAKRAAHDPKEQGDHGLLAWIVTLELQALCQHQCAERAVKVLAAALSSSRLRPHCETLLRTFGTLVEDEPGWLEHQALKPHLGTNLDALPHGPTRLPDALVAHWQARHSTGP